ncbi:hypothetical protein, partial [Clostridium sp.]|uniref:hypothetical protein n=1 Tax=Clostridium sp. TaxID=1506 RepID=UPI00257D7077
LPGHYTSDMEKYRVVGNQPVKRNPLDLLQIFFHVMIIKTCLNSIENIGKSREVSTWEFT